MKILDEKLQKMRLPLQFRSLSVFSRHIKDFSLETPTFSVIEPVLATDYVRENQARLPEKSNLLTNIPSYVDGEDENPPMNDEIIYTNDEIAAISESSSIAAHCVRISREILQPGTTTSNLNNILHEEITSKYVTYLVKNDLNTYLLSIFSSVLISALYM